jgi:hypothetical protein
MRKGTAIENGNERESENLIIIISIIWMNEWMNTCEAKEKVEAVIDR